MKITKEFFSQLVARELDFQDKFQNDAWGGESPSDEKWVLRLLSELGGLSECVDEGSEAGLLNHITRMAAMLQAWVITRDFEDHDENI